MNDFVKVDTLDNSTSDNLAIADLLLSELFDKQQLLTSLNESANSIKKIHLKKIDAWLEDQSAPIISRIDEISLQLQLIAERELNGKGKKSISLPAGRFGFVKASPTFFFDGDKADGKHKALIEAVEKLGLGRFINYKPSLDWTSLKKTLAVDDQGRAFSNDGLLFTGLTAVINPDRFFCKPSDAHHSVERT